MVATLEDCAIVASLVLSGVAQGAVVAVLAIATDALNYAPVTGGLKTAAVLAGSALILCYMAVVRHWLSATEGDGFERWHGWRNFALVFTATVTASLFSMLDNAHPPISADGRSISPRDGLDASFCNWCAVPRILAGLVVLTLMVFSWATTTARADRDRTKRPGGAAASCGGWRAVQLALACAQLLFGAGLASAFDSPSCYTIALDAAWNCVKEDAALAYAWRMCCLSGDDQLQPTARCVEMRAVLLDARDEFHTASYIFVVPALFLALIRNHNWTQETGRQVLDTLASATNVYAAIFFSRGAGLLLFLAEHYGAACFAGDCDDIASLQATVNDRAWVAVACACLALAGAAMAIV